MLSVICVRTWARKIKNLNKTSHFVGCFCSTPQLQPKSHLWLSSFPYMQILYGSTERGGLSDALLPLVSASTPTARAHILPLEPLIRRQARFHRLFSRPSLPAVSPQHTERDPHDEVTRWEELFLWPLMMIMKMNCIWAHYSHISATESAAFTSDFFFF